MKSFTHQIVLGCGVLCASLGSSTLAGAATASFSCTGYPQYFQVPANVTSVTFVSTGAAGGKVAGASGFGGVVKGTLSVTPNEVLTVKVGCAPFKYSKGALNNRLYVSTGGFGFANGGNGAVTDTASFGGGGGGATGISTSTGTILIVAAGGGGGGAGGLLTNGGGDGGNGDSTSGAAGTFGGAGGTLGGSSTAAGANGSHGSLGDGGGGGGGFVGGGGGGGSNSGRGGGGGGGTSFTLSTRVSNAVRSVASSVDDGSLVLTFNGTLTAQPSTFTCVSKQEFYAIPAAAKALRVIAIGAKGGDPKDAYGNVLSDPSSGLGAGFDALITTDNFPANRIFTVAVGCQGGSGQSASWFSTSAAGGAGGFGAFTGGNGGAGNKLNGTDPKDGAMGGNGGGGASAVFGGTVTPRFPPIVAGGGGGAGGLGYFILYSNKGGSGGNGGGYNVDNIDGSDGGGTGGGKGGKSTDTLVSLDGSGAASDSNAGGGGGAGGGLETIDFGITSNAGKGGSGIAAGGGGGMGGNSGQGGGNVIVDATKIDVSTYFNRNHQNGLILITPLF